MPRSNGVVCRGKRYPNQLHAALVDNGRLYVTAVCTSPRGPTGTACRAGMTCGANAIESDPINPANFQTAVHAAVFTLDSAATADDPPQRSIDHGTRAEPPLPDAAPDAGSPS